MKCKNCGIKIKVTQYTGLGEYENVCPDCSKNIIKNKLPQMRDKYLEMLNSTTKAK